MGIPRWPAVMVLASALLSGCGRSQQQLVAVTVEAPGATPHTDGSVARPPRVVPAGMSDDEVLEAADWRLEGLPAISRDGRRVATVFSHSWGYRAIVDEANPNFDEPNGIVEYPNWSFVVVDAKTAAIARRDSLVDAAELEAAQRQRSLPALAETVRRRLAATNRALAAGGYEAMPAVELNGSSQVHVDGVNVRVTTQRLSITDASDRPRLDVTVAAWAAPPLPMSFGFTCTYTPRIEQLAVDDARGIAVVLVAQDTNGGDACAGAVNAERKLKLLRLAMRARSSRARSLL